MCKVQNQSIILGLLFNDGSSWKSHRRFALKSLRDLGFGKSSLEHVLVEEADRMGEYFIDQKGQPFLVQSLFNLVILNVLWTIVANKRYTVLHIFRQVLFGAGNQGNHQNFEKSLLTNNFGMF